MKLKQFINLLFLLCAFSLFGQGEAANWYFGEQAGLTFNTAPPSTLTDGQLNALEGCTTISNSEGVLLFYTNGVDIYNAAHEIMQNGTGLLGDLSSSQSAIIVPDPGDFNKYYVFTVDDLGGPNGLNYSVVDMTLDGGFGGVIPGEKNIQLATPVVEKITAVYHENGEDIWVISHMLGTNEFIAYLVTSEGLSLTPIVSSIGPIHFSGFLGSGTAGYLKISPNGKKIAVAILGGPSASVGLFDFDTTSGFVSNPIIVNNLISYGVEFSPNSKVLYSTSGSPFYGRLLQYDITSDNESLIQLSQMTISPNFKYAALQLGIDGKIYVAQEGQSTLSIINTPNQLGAACDFEEDAVNLMSRNSGYGLPPFIQSFFQYEIGYEFICHGQETQFEIITYGDVATASWDFGDPASGPDNFSNDLAPTHIFTAPGVYTVTVDIVNAFGYEISLSEVLEILPSPEALFPGNMEVCDVLPNDGFSEFDLTTQDAIILNGQDPDDYGVAYHTDLAEAEEGVNAILDPGAFTNTVPGTQTIYARVTDLENGCFSIVFFDLIVYEVPEPGVPEPLTACDTLPNDGFAEFDLSLADDAIINGQIDVFVGYYETLAQAEAGDVAFELPQFYTNTVANNQTIFARLEADAFGCFSTIEVELIVYPAPEVSQDIAPLSLCDADGSGSVTVDLTLHQDAILEGLSGVSIIGYYNSLANAQNDTDPILDPTNYTSGGSETIYVRVEDDVTGCYSVGFFELVIYDLPSYVALENLTICDDEVANGMAEFNLNVAADFMAGGNPDLAISFYFDLADAETGTDPLPMLYTNTIPYLQTIYVRIVDVVTGCFDRTPLDLIVMEAPIINPDPSPLVVCDLDSNGFASFTLSDADDDITLGDPDLTVTYHGTELDAINGVNELDTPYVNDDPYFDIVWARVESPVISCSNIVALRLEVRNTPDIATPEPLQLCDVNNPGDGVEVFDLTVVEAEVLNGLDPAHYDIYYYVDQGNAIAAGESALDGPPGDFSLAIANPGAYQNQLPFFQTIYILVVGNDLSIDPTITIPPDQHPTGENCYAIVELDLIVDPLPVANLPLPYELCDDWESGSTTDQISIFDLTTKEDEITGGVPGLIVTWYLTPEDEQADIPIPNPEAFANNTGTPQTVVARVTDAQGCSDTTTLTLVVLPNPTPIVPTPLEACDNGDDLGFANFDLSLRDIEIMNGEEDVEVTYYIDLPTAEAGVPGTELPILYTNEVPFFQTVYARVTRVLNPPMAPLACFTIVPLDLIVQPLPDVAVEGFGDLFSCDTDGDGTAEFDLTLNTPFVIGTQDPDDLTGPTYHTSLADAEEGTGAIVNTTGFPSTGQVIWVRLEFTATGCYRLSEFELIVGEFPVIIDPLEMRLCDDLESGSTTDGVTVFDLTQNNAFITGGNPDYEVFYYETQADQDANDPIPNPDSYENIDNPQVLFVSVFSLSEGCEARTTLTIEVLPVPAAVAFEADGLDYETCDGNADGFALFDLSSQNPILANGDTDVLITYHETLLDAQDGVFAINPAVPYENLVPWLQTLYVRVEREVLPPGTDPACFVIIELRLRVLPTPVVPLELDPIVQCDDDIFSEFDLTIYEDLIYGNQTPPDYAITYHLSEADAMAGTPFIPNPEAYTNIINPQPIWVRLGDGNNGCFNLVSFMIEVTPGPVAIQPTPLDMCDDLGEDYDGVTVFDLTEKVEEITGGVAGLEVWFYEDEEDAQLGQGHISPANAYEGHTLQLLYVRVEDSNTGCVDFTTLLLRVYSNPLVGAPDPLELCDVTDPGTGIEVFDLVEAQAQVLNGGDWEVLYYELYEDALEGDPALAIAPLGATSVPYANTVPYGQVIYVRVTNQNQELRCFEIVELTLIVNPLPDDSAAVSDLIVCAVGAGDVAYFNLEDREEDILNGQGPDVFQVTYYRNQAEAETNTNPIISTTEFLNTSNPQTIYTGILNTETGCYIGGNQSFDLIVQEGVLITTPVAPLEACENYDEDGIGTGEGTFDLTALDAEILTGQDPTEYILTYHESIEDAQAGTGAIPNPASYTSPTAVIWARVSYTDPNPVIPPGTPDCYEVVEVSLVVVPAPEFEPLLESYRLCVDEFGNPIAEEFGMTSPPVIDTGLGAPGYIFIWEIDGEIQFGESQGSIVATRGGTYTVTIIDAVTGCGVTTQTEVILSSPPLAYGATTGTVAFQGSQVVEATAEGLGDYVFQLNDGPFVDVGYWEGVAPGTHTVTITDANGCGSVAVEVNVIGYPLFFTPNNDGYHDTWNIIGLAENPGAKVFIFDRYGKLLKQLSPSDRGWDGTYKGNPMPSNDYWFRVVYTEDGDTKEFRAHFTLKR